MAATDQRRAMLDQLRLKREGVIPNLPDSPERARDTKVLVPSSSSPAGPASRGSTLIPSSNLSRPTAPASGSPQALMSTIKRPPAADYSPDSPQPLSRLKRRYDDSPTKTSGSTTPLPPSSSSSRPKLPAGKLIGLAKQSHDDNTEKQIVRLTTQFRNLSRATIAQTLKRNDNDMDATLIELSEAAKNPPKQSNGSSSSIASSLQNYRFQPPVSTLSSPPLTAQSASPKKRGRKNEKSTIYAQREKTRHRDPDDESEAASSGNESDGWSGDETRKRQKSAADDDIDAEGAALKAFNEAEASVITGTIACSEDQAAKIIKLRPYADADDVYTKLNKARGVSYKLFEQYVEIMEGYVQIDVCLNKCEQIAQEIASTLAVWKGAATQSDSITGTPRSDGLNDARIDVAKVSELLLKEKDVFKKKILSSYIRQQPSLLSEGTVLKDYQLLGVNWLNLLYTRRIGCILADEMGLGKTIQVIAFLAHLKEQKVKGPHMIFVPASTLENWTREFERFAPDIEVHTYYGTQSERADLRNDLKRLYRRGKLEVVLASYTQVASHDDLAFFRKKIDFQTCIYDEGHALKSFNTKRYKDLLSIVPKWRLLLTGTPVQNNLQELVSLLMFIHTDMFTDAEPYLRSIFKVQGAGATNLLSQNRVSRARTMLTPFVLRRRKANVLTLPPKTESIERCQMTPAQARLYRETMKRSRKAIESMGEDALEAAAAADDDDDNSAAKGKGNGKKKDAAKPKTSSANILMDLRKAANHPLLFRRLYNASKVRQIAKECLNTPKWCDSVLEYVIEDLEVMSDAEIHAFVSEVDELSKFALDPSVFLECGKVRALETHLERCKAEGKRMLLFSQFTMILDILQVALDHLGIKYIRLDGGTRTDERQSLVDEFNEDPEITVFLLSTKAGGVGINLTAASVVVIFDQDFNPHNDRQAADRAYRIGQEREVEVIKFISKDSIDEDILSIGMTKLQLDDMVAAADEGATDASDDKAAKEVKKSLLTTLRTKFEAQKQDDEADADDDIVEIDEMPASTQVKKARGVERE